ncbi:hypothetical protein [Streptomyces hawaiiensis]
MTTLPRRQVDLPGWTLGGIVAQHILAAHTAVQHLSNSVLAG